jgi:hypothetical protein
VEKVDETLLFDCLMFNFARFIIPRPNLQKIKAFSYELIILERHIIFGKNEPKSFHPHSKGLLLKQCISNLSLKRMSNIAPF